MAAGVIVLVGLTGVALGLVKVPSETITILTKVTAVAGTDKFAAGAGVEVCEGAADGVSLGIGVADGAAVVVWVAVTICGVLLGIFVAEGEINVGVGRSSCDDSPSLCCARAVAVNSRSPTVSGAGSVALSENDTGSLHAEPSKPITAMKYRIFLIAEPSRG